MSAILKWSKIGFGEIMMNDCYVFRIDYGSQYNLIRDELFQHGKLRQGWGADGMQLTGEVDSFKCGWEKRWGSEDESKVMKRFNALQTMTEISAGDYIVIPKISQDVEGVCRCFTVVKCKKGYQFAPIESVNDFGHYLEVEVLFSCGYDKDENSAVVKKGLQYYRRAVNPVHQAQFKEAVDELVKMHSSDPVKFKTLNKDFLEIVDATTDEARKFYLQDISKKISSLFSPNFLENLIVELFEKNGYAKTGRNWYDKHGGDIDIVFEAWNKNTLLYDIYDICEQEMPHVYVQAKSKQGKDYNDVEGINQLIGMMPKIKEQGNAIFILINTTDKFSETAKELAMENGIILIDGLTFASLLVRYGISMRME